MSFDAITSIAQAEEAAKNAVAFAQAQARQMIADAESAGKKSIEDAVRKAESELLELRNKADAKSAEGAGKIASEVENLKANLRNAAEARLDKAAEHVVERIVKG